MAHRFMVVFALVLLAAMLPAPTLAQEYTGSCDVIPVLDFVPVEELELSVRPTGGAWSSWQFPFGEKGGFEPVFASADNFYPEGCRIEKRCRWESYTYCWDEYNPNTGTTVRKCEKRYRYVCRYVKVCTAD